MTYDIPSEIVDFIKNNGVLSLAVAGADPWICTLYYGLDEEMNFYLVSDPNSVHGKIIEKIPTVAFNIFDSHTKITELKKGIQGKGLCSQVKDLKEVIKGLLLWHKANPGIETKLTIEDIKKLKNKKIYKVIPTYLKFFNKETYGSKEYGIWEK